MNKTKQIWRDVTINEGDTPDITVTGYDANGVIISGANIVSVTMRIDDYFSETCVHTSTNLGTSNPITHTLTNSETRIIDQAREYEYRFATFDFVYDTDKHIVEEFVIKVNNPGFYP